MGKFSGVTTPKELSLFPQFSLAFLSRSANGCGLLKGAVEGSAWIFYPDKVQDSRVALNHAVCPVWIKHTHKHSDKSLSIHLCLAASPRAYDVPYQRIDAWHKLFYDRVEAVCFLIWALMSHYHFHPTPSSLFCFLTFIHLCGLGPRPWWTCPLSSTNMYCKRRYWKRAQAADFKPKG